MRAFIGVLFINLCILAEVSANSLSPDLSKTIFHRARLQIAQILKNLPADKTLSTESKLILLSNLFTNSPYLSAGTGEGDWLPNTFVYKPGGKHAKSRPVYRTDGFDCVTYVQTLLALVTAKDLASFDRNYIRSAYGAIDDTASVNFDNRNHFTDTDWNRINEKFGIISDVTTSGALARYAKMIHVNINRARWKQFQQTSGNLPQGLQKTSVDVLMSYLPKEVLFSNHGALLNQLPTPAVLEIIRDPKKWLLNGKPIAAAIGSETSVSHLGIIYRRQFQLGETIYKRIHCESRKRFCLITPIFCAKKKCTLIMFSHATDGYPRPHHQFNRVEHIPLLQYFTDNRDGNYNYMLDDSILGVHVEQISVNKPLR